MVVCIVQGVVAIRGRKTLRHQAGMTRAYAMEQGADPHLICAVSAGSVSAMRVLCECVMQCRRTCSVLNWRRINARAIATERNVSNVATSHQRVPSANNLITTKSSPPAKAVTGCPKALPACPPNAQPPSVAAVSESPLSGPVEP